MGNTIWVDVRGRKKKEPLRDNSIMLNLEKQLDGLAPKLNVAKPSEFFDYSELISQFEDEFDEDTLAAVNETTRESWFHPASALASVRALRSHLEHHFEDLGFKPDKSRSHWPASLMEDLRHCEEVLEMAATSGREFRFLIVP